MVLWFCCSLFFLVFVEARNETANPVFFKLVAVKDKSSHLSVPYETSYGVEYDAKIVSSTSKDALVCNSVTSAQKTAEVCLKNSTYCASVAIDGPLLGTGDCGAFPIESTSGMISFGGGAGVLRLNSDALSFSPFQENIEWATIIPSVEEDRLTFVMHDLSICGHRLDSLTSAAAAVLDLNEKCLLLPQHLFDILNSLDIDVKALSDNILSFRAKSEAISGSITSFGTAACLAVSRDMQIRVGWSVLRSVTLVMDPASQNIGWQLSLPRSSCAAVLPVCHPTLQVHTIYCSLFSSSFMSFSLCSSGVGFVEQVLCGFVRQLLFSAF